MSPLRSLGRLRALLPAERSLLLRALALLPLYAAGVRLRGLRPVRRWFRGLPAVANATPAQAARMVLLAARRGPWKTGCLPTALTLQRLLASQGVDSELRLGVRKAGARLEAHAWLECAGEPLIDTRGAHETFAPFERAAGSR